MSFYTNHKWQVFVLYIAICLSIIVFQNVTYQAHMQNEWTDQCAYFYSVCTIESVMRKGKKVPRAYGIQCTALCSCLDFFPGFSELWIQLALTSSLMSATRLSVCGAGPSLTHTFLICWTKSRQTHKTFPLLVGVNIKNHKRPRVLKGKINEK